MVLFAEIYNVKIRTDWKPHQPYASHKMYRLSNNQKNILKYEIKSCTNTVNSCQSFACAMQKTRFYVIVVGWKMFDKRFKSWEQAQENRLCTWKEAELYISHE